MIRVIGGSKVTWHAITAIIVKEKANESIGTHKVIGVISGFKTAWRAITAITPSI